MKIKTRKVIAREFLVLVSVTILGLFSFLLTYPYNWHLSSKLAEIDNNVSLEKDLADNLSKSFDSKTINGKDYAYRVYQTIKENTVEFAIQEFSYSQSEFRQKILSDKTFQENIYSTLQKNIEGFVKSRIEFDSCLKSQLTAIDVKNKKEAEIIRDRTNKAKFLKEKVLLSMLTFNEQISVAVRTIIYSALILFLLRYFFYAVRWSINTLKQKQTLQD
jgi:hypothetical protein